jgi:hypothetical protein
MARKFEPMGDIADSLVALVDTMLQVSATDRPTAAEVLERSRDAKEML